MAINSPTSALTDISEFFTKNLAKILSFIPSLQLIPVQTDLNITKIHIQYAREKYGKIFMIFVFLLNFAILAQIPSHKALAKNPSKTNIQFKKIHQKSKMIKDNQSKTNQKSNYSDIGEENSQPNLQEAILAGGCFWGIQELLEDLPGVVKSEVGYIGGSMLNPNYEMVKTGISGYAEAVKITFDAKKISYEKILRYFLAIHDPTQINQQGNDIGTQYRSEIFYLNNDQKIIAETVLNRAKKSGKFKKPIATRISSAGKFYFAEEYHQNYLKKNPYGYNCHFLREDWLI